MFCVVARGEGGGSGWGWGWGWGGSAGCNRLVTSIDELTLGPFPCQLRPGGDVFSAWDLGWVRVIVARGVSRRG